MEARYSEQEARALLRRRSLGITGLFHGDAARLLRVRAEEALEHCRDYGAALERQHRRRLSAALGPRPLFEEVEDLIADLEAREPPE